MSWDYRSVARITKTHGRNGEVVVVGIHGLPALMRPGLEVFPVPPALKGRRMLTVERSSEGGGSQLVRFAGVESLDAAHKLVGKALLVRRADIDASIWLQDADSVVGRELRDVDAGAVGVVEEVLRGPVQDVWVVRTPTGEVLVPAALELMVRYEDEGPVVMQIPDGLLGDDAQ